MIDESLCATQDGRAALDHSGDLTVPDIQTGETSTPWMDFHRKFTVPPVILLSGLQLKVTHNYVSLSANGPGINPPVDSQTYISAKLLKQS